jgi:hypothetical protein
MSIVITVDGATLTHDVAPTSLQITQRAAKGEAAFGGLAIQDPGDTFAVNGHRPITITGWITQRDYGRSLERGLFVGDDPRLVDMTIVDLNASFDFLVFHQDAANRPAEAIDDRMAWLLASEQVAPFIADTGYVSVTPGPGSTGMMDAADYRGSTPRSVLDDMAARWGDYLQNWFAFWDASAGKAALYFDTADTPALGTSTLSISNDLADINGTTIFAPSTDTKLAREPDAVYSEVVYEWAHGTQKTYRKRPATLCRDAGERGVQRRLLALGARRRDRPADDPYPGAGGVGRAGPRRDADDGDADAHRVRHSDRLPHRLVLAEADRRPRALLDPGPRDGRRGARRRRHRAGLR